MAIRRVSVAGNQGYFLAFNGGKRSITLDLKSARGAEVFTRLLKTADVVVDNYGPGVLQRMGFGLRRDGPNQFLRVALWHQRVSSRALREAQSPR